MERSTYKIVGAFDTETTNLGDVVSGYRAFPILYQFGRLETPIEELTPANCAERVNVQLFRHCADLYEYLDSLISSLENNTVGVVLVHNLGFDMYALAPWLNTKETKALAKTARKPVTLTVLEEGKPRLVFLDTLGLFMKSLARMGEECGMQKAVGEWDYMKIRTPETPITADEEHYAKQDIYTLLCYVSYFLRQNPDIEPSDIGSKIVTKTGVVRHKRMKHLGSVKGEGLKRTVNQMWNYHNREQLPQTDSELFAMHACTRGGFTFCASHNASRIFHETETHAIAAYDATSMHPSMMVSHFFPVGFKSASVDFLNEAIKGVGLISLEYLLEKWANPFPSAFNALFAFENLRPRKDSLYSRDGIMPLASARLGKTQPNSADAYNESSDAFKLAGELAGYRDTAEGAKVCFGKIESADYCELWLTELGLWEVMQAYDFDSIKPLGGYYTFNFRKPTDLSLLSVMRFYKAKSALKDVMRGGNPVQLQGLFPESFVKSMMGGDADEKVRAEYYQLSKADLNALFGIEATNEARQDFEITPEGLQLTGTPGLENMPKNPKCWYQFGQRIVGWSRIAQHAAMQLVEPYTENIICGDTDSFKLYYAKDNETQIEAALARLGNAIDKAKKRVCARVEYRYSDYFDALPAIGHYVSEGTYSAFSASWNKSYIGVQDGRLHMTLAGVPTSRGEHSIEWFGEYLLENGADFDSVASLLIGYNVTFDYSLTLLNGKKHPKWGEWFTGYVTDYRGQKSYVNEPMALAIYPEPKTIGNTEQVENATNLVIALGNNPNVNAKPAMLAQRNGVPEVIE